MNILLSKTNIFNLIFSYFIKCYLTFNMILFNFKFTKLFNLVLNIGMFYNYLIINDI